jgi:hypothetical protein
MFWTITALEAIAGVLCGLGAIGLLLGLGPGLALWGLVFSTLSLLCLFFGQRMAKDYGGRHSAGRLLCGSHAEADPAGHEEPFMKPGGMAETSVISKRFVSEIMPGLAVQYCLEKQRVPPRQTGAVIAVRSTKEWTNAVSQVVRQCVLPAGTVCVCA